MICKNCNAVVEEGSIFCGTCGTRIEQLLDEQPVSEQISFDAAPQAPAQPTDSDAENVFFSQATETEPQQYTYAPIPSPAPKKNRFGKKAAVIAVVIAVLVGIVGAFASLGDFFKSDAELYREIESESVNEIISLLSGTLDDALDFEGGSASVKINVSDDVIKMLGSEASMLGDIRSAGADINFAKAGSILGGRVDLSVSDTELFGYEIVFDTEENAFYMSLPGLNEKAVKIDFSELMSNNGMSMRQFADGFNEITEFLNRTDIKPVASDIISAALSGINNVHKSKGTVTAGGVRQNCTVYTVNIDETVVENVIKAVLNEVKNNKSIKDIAYECMDLLTAINGGASMYTKSQLSSMIDEGIDNAINSIDLSGAEIDFVYRLYADSHDVLGRELIAEGQTLKLASAKAGNDYAFECSFGDEDDKEFNICAEGTMKSDKFTGDMRFEVNGENMLVADFENFKADMEKQSIHGKMTLGLGSGAADMVDIEGPSAFALKSAELEFTFNNTKDKADTLVAFKAGGAKLAEIALKGAYKTDYIPKLPDNVYTGDIDDYMSSVDPYTLIERLKKAGFPEELFGGVMPYEEPMAPTASVDPFAEDFDIDDVIEGMDEDELNKYLEQFGQ